jgi:thiamine-phosphate pyrophosphorylase
MGAVEVSGLRGLYAVTPDWADSARLLAVTRAILDGGCRLVQYRNKTANAALRVAQARALRALTRMYGARLIVNDDPDLALAVGADGVHLGAQDGDLASARALLGPAAVLGASCYQSLPQARTAVAAGANYVAFGAVFPSPTKPQAGRATPALLAEAVRSLPVPVAAIGGITLANVQDVIATGVRLVAVISALYDAPDPAWAAARFTASFANGKEMHDLSQ